MRSYWAQRKLNASVVLDYICVSYYWLFEETQNVILIKLNDINSYYPSRFLVLLLLFKHVYERTKTTNFIDRTG